MPHHSDRGTPPNEAAPDWDNSPSFYCFNFLTILHSRPSRLSSFMNRPQTGNSKRKLTASSGGFGNFREALTFVQEIGELAEAEGHHPNISFGWGNATVSLQTKKIKGLHENDFIMAAKIDRIFARAAKV
jgi:pterin-4a-carbinolamine dehydratase